MPGAYLFAGPAGVGKSLAAREFIKAVNCRSGVGDACDECQSCRLIDKGQFPDMLVAESKGGKILKGSSASEKTGNSLSELLPRLHYRPMMGRHKFLVLEPADGLTEEAANMLLKTLEEPPALTTFILITARERSVLPTVMSRCQRVRFEPLSESVILELLLERGVAEGIAALAARAGNGSLGCALEATQPGYVKQRTVCADLLLGWSGGDLVQRVETGLDFVANVSREGGGEEGKAAEERRAMDLLADVAAMLCRDMLWVLSGESQAVVLSERESAVRSMARRAGYSGALALSVLVGELRDAMSHNENSRNVLNWFGSEWNRRATGFDG